MKVYLGGPINGCTDEEANGWRDEVKSLLDTAGIDYLDPMRRDYRGRFRRCEGVDSVRVALSSVFIGLAVLANWLASKYVVGVPFTSYVAPAGVFCIGAALVLRDWIQQIAGLRWTLALVVIGGAASYLIGDAAGWTSLQKIAVASLVAFIVSETVETAVFTPLRNRSLTGGVLASGLIGNALDSWLFLTLAFGSTAFFWGNFYGKAEMILIGGLMTAFRRYALPVTE